MGKEIGHEEAFQRRVDHRFPGQCQSGTAYQEAMPRQGFSKASYYLWCSKHGGMSVPDAKRLKELETENTHLKKLLAKSLLEMEVTS